MGARCTDFPGIGAVPLAIAPVALAVARAAINEVKNGAAEDRLRFWQATAGARRSTADAGSGGGNASWRRDCSTMTRSPRRGIRTFAGERSTLEQKADLLLGAGHAAATASEVTHRMHRIAGTPGTLREESSRATLPGCADAAASRIHVGESVRGGGKVYLGLEPEFMMLAF